MRYPRSSSSSSSFLKTIASFLARARGEYCASEGGKFICTNRRWGILFLRLYDACALFYNFAKRERETDTFEKRETTVLYVYSWKERLPFVLSSLESNGQEYTVYIEVQSFFLDCYTQHVVKWFQHSRTMSYYNVLELSIRTTSTPDKDQRRF